MPQSCCITHLDQNDTSLTPSFVTTSVVDKRGSIMFCSYLPEWAITETLYCFVTTRVKDNRGSFLLCDYTSVVG